VRVKNNAEPAYGELKISPISLTLHSGAYDPQALSIPLIKQSEQSRKRCGGGKTGACEMGKGRVIA